MEKSIKILKIDIMLITITSVLVFNCLAINSKVSCIKNERHALLKLKQSLSDPTNMLASWVGEDCCAWKGVICSNKTGRIVKLDLHNPISLEEHFSGNEEEGCLGGELSHSLLDLHNLEHLDVSMNCFYYIHIPKFLGSIKTLKYLNLSQSYFSGVVPHSLGNLSSLEILDLSCWNSDLKVDNFHWISTLFSLKHLDLSAVSAASDSNWLRAINMLPSLAELHLLSCELPSIPLFLQKVNFTSLRVLDLSSNWLNSSVPYWIFNLSGLEYLDLSLNYFRGVIPDQIGKQNALRLFDLSYNVFEGNMPETLGNLCNLQELHLAGNNFSGDFSMSLGNESGCIQMSLKVLNLGYNSFIGVLPVFLGRFKGLEVLDLPSNSLIGPIPTSIGNLSSLKVLSVFGNYLNGRIPESIGQLANLEILDVSHNLLDGVLSELHFAGLRSLRHLNMEINPLDFHVDFTWVPSFQLEWISLSSCNVGPEFPQWLKFQKNISYMDMSNSSISNSIPDWFESISSSIVQLDLSHNHINKKLPRLRGLNNNSAYQRYIFLHHNNFDGPLTTFPSDVIVLDLSNNLLSGHIPQNFGSMMPNLQFLSLSNNHLNGSILTSVCEMIVLEFLDLSRNQFSGRLPSCWNEMQQLKVLDFANNSLTGHIPISLGSVKSLLSLHLQHNKFQGNFPPLTELELLRTLDLSENVFSGSLPHWIGDRLSELRVLNIRSNKFGDEIPLQLCRLSSLRILNLANNMLNGTIPPCFQNLTAMIESNSSVEVSWDYYFNGNFLNGTQAAGYNESVKAYIKGIELEYTKSIRYLFSIDMSENNLSGDIPKMLMRLSGLRNLNLSGNKLAGHIPLEIGNLKLLESLDLSRNELSGSIPSTISELNFLSFLNVSFNKLSGRIPKGNQLQTLTDKSIYMGNDALCGPPLKSCPEDELPNLHHETVEKTMKEDSEMPWFYCGLAIGFLTGFVGVCSILYFKNSWRYAWFKLVDDIYIKLSVMTAVKANQLRQKLNM